MTLLQEQSDICKKYNTEMLVPEPNVKLGIALSSIVQMPINGVRHIIENGTCGWYIWCGEELSEDKEFFKPLHVCHVNIYLQLRST